MFEDLKCPLTGQQKKRRKLFKVIVYNIAKPQWAKWILHTTNTVDKL